LKELKDVKAQEPHKFFTSEEKNIKMLSPYMLKFTISLLLENGASWLTSQPCYMKSLFGLCTSMMVKFWNTGKEKKVVKDLLTSCLHLIFYTSENLKEMYDSGVLEGIVNNQMITKVAKAIDFDTKDNDNIKFSE
jgi:hypothetical protein